MSQTSKNNYSIIQKKFIETQMWKQTQEFVTITIYTWTFTFVYP